MENGLLYVLAFIAMAIALLACVLPQASNLELINADYTYFIYADGSNYIAETNAGTEIYRSTNASYIREQCFNLLPDNGGKIVFYGNATFDTPLTILKNNTIYEHNVGYELFTNHGYIFGDNTHFVQGFNFKIGWMDGLNQTFNCIIGRNGWRGRFDIGTICRFDKAVYLDPVSVGFGENYFYLNSVTANNYGIDSNSSCPANMWAQGNVFFASIFASDTYGVRMLSRTGDPYAYNEFHCTIDSQVGIDPMFPTYGGGVDLYDTAGWGYYYCRYYTSPTISSSSWYFNNYYGRVPFSVIKQNKTVAIGLNSAYGAATSYKLPRGLPEEVTIYWGGTFNSETVTVAFQVQANASATLYKIATATGSVALSLSELYSLVADNQRFNQLDVWATTTRAGSTQVTVAVNVYG